MFWLNPMTFFLNRRRFEMILCKYQFQMYSEFPFFFLSFYLQLLFFYK